MTRLHIIALAVFLGGVVCAIVGLYFVFWPLALIVGGLMLSLVAAVFVPFETPEQKRRRERIP